MPEASTLKKLKYRKSNPYSPKKESQGVLLLERAVNKYQAYEDAEELLDKIKREFNKKGNKLILSKSGDEIHYFNDYLKAALKILENFK